MRDWCSECRFANYGGSQEPCYNCVTAYNKKPSEFTPATDEVHDYAELIAGLRDCAKHTCCSAPPATSLAADAIEELLAFAQSVARRAVDAQDDEVSAEVLCRKLYKLGIIEKDGAWWHYEPPKEGRTNV